jgi:hypothetical protein
MIPFNSRPFGMGVAEVGRFMQDQLNTLNWLRAAAMIKTVNAPTIADPSQFDDISQLEEPASDQLVLLRSGGDINRAAAQMQYNYGTLFTAAQMIQEDRAAFRDGTGVIDIVRGIPAGGRTTAKEVSELTTQGNIPIDVRVDLIENEDLPHLARDVGQRFILALRDLPNRDKVLQEILGDPNAKLEHLSRDLSIQFVGSARFNAKGGFGGVVTLITQLLTSRPEMAPFINWPRLVVDVAKLASPDAAERYLLDPSSALGQATAAQALGGPPQPGVASQPRPVAVGQ